MVEKIKDLEQVVELPIGVIERGFYQPRELFDPELMESTQRSIAEKGQKYPVIVRPITLNNPLFNKEWSDIHYELADGERRTRCLKALGASTVLAIIRDLNDWEMLDYGVTTNDSVPLNPIERAKVFQRLSREFRKSQEEIAKSYNMKQQQVSEYVRLLELPAEIQDLTARAVISLRHARELLKLPKNETMISLCKEIVDTKMSTRKLTERVKEIQEKNENLTNNDQITHEDIIFEVESKDIELEEDKSTLDSNLPKESYFQNEVKISSKNGENDVSSKQSFWFSFIEPLVQVNSILLVGPFKAWVESYMLARPSLKKMKPELFVSLCELSLLIPTLVIFFLYIKLPFVAISLSSLCASLLLIKLIEENPPNS